MKDQLTHIKLFRALLNSLENENEIYARVLHDDIFPQILVAKLKYAVTKSKLEKIAPPETIAELDEQSQLVTETIDILKHVYYALYPSLLKHLGLAKSIRQAITDFSELYDVTVDYSYETNISEPNIDIEVKVQMYRAMFSVLKLILRTNPQLEFDVNLKFGNSKYILTLNSKASLISSKIKIIKKNDPTLLPVLARLVVLNAEIDERTNWKSYCKITFPL